MLAVPNLIIPDMLISPGAAPSQPPVRYVYQTDHRCPGLNRISQGKWYVPKGKSANEITFCSWCVNSGAVDPGSGSTITVNVGPCNCEGYLQDRESLIKMGDITFTCWKPNLRTRYYLIPTRTKRLMKIGETNDSQHTVQHTVQIKSGSSYYLLIQCPGYFRVKIENTDFDVETGLTTYYKDYVLIPRQFEYHQKIDGLTNKEWEQLSRVSFGKMRLTITRFERVPAIHPLKMSNRYLGRYVISDCDSAGLTLNINDELVRSSFNCVIHPTMDKEIPEKAINYTIDRFVPHGEPCVTVVRFQDRISTTNQIMRAHRTALFELEEDAIASDATERDEKVTKRCGGEEEEEVETEVEAEYL